MKAISVRAWVLLLGRQHVRANPDKAKNEGSYMGARTVEILENDDIFAGLREQLAHFGLNPFEWSILRPQRELL